MNSVDQAGSASAKFDHARAADYGVQARVALAGYDACQELGACVLASLLGTGQDASVLVVGAGGTGLDVTTAALLEPGWRFTAVDPSPDMLKLARDAYERAGIADRVILHEGELSSLPSGQTFDAAIVVGVIHHLPSESAKADLLRMIASLLGGGSPMIIAGNRGAYASQPLLLGVWRERWRQFGAAPSESERKLATIMQGAEPPASDEALADLLRLSGFEQPTLYFSSLFWGAWMTRRA